MGCACSHGLRMLSWAAHALMGCASHGLRMLEPSQRAPHTQHRTHVLARYSTPCMTYADAVSTSVSRPYDRMKACPAARVLYSSANQPGTFSAPCAKAVVGRGGCALYSSANQLDTFSHPQSSSALWALSSPLPFGPSVLLCPVGPVASLRISNNRDRSGRSARPRTQTRPRPLSQQTCLAPLPARQARPRPLSRRTCLAPLPARQARPRPPACATDTASPPCLRDKHGLAHLRDRLSGWAVEDRPDERDGGAAEHRV
eukprot:356435-Chlamydomonas_euryale.AAC.5